MSAKILFLGLLFLTSGVVFSQEDTLELELTNISEQRGRIWVGIYTGEDDFLDREKARLEYFDVTKLGNLIVKIAGLEKGKQYALGIFHDVDNDGDLNTNIIGLPAEPWGMTGSLQSWFRAPYFEEMAFTFDPQKREAVKLRKL